MGQRQSKVSGDAEAQDRLVFLNEQPLHDPLNWQAHDGPDGPVTLGAPTDNLEHRPLDRTKPYSNMPPEFMHEEPEYIRRALLEPYGRPYLGPPVDLKNYEGLWYSYLNTTACFQPECMENVTATYAADLDNNELHLINRGTCCGLCTCSARGSAVPVHGERLAEGPRQYHVHFCINAQWNDRPCAKYCSPVGSYEILYVGYVENGRLVDAPPRSPLAMEYSSGLDRPAFESAKPHSGRYDIAIVGNRARTMVWLLTRKPFDDTKATSAANPEPPISDKGDLVIFLRRFGYSDDILDQLRFVKHRNPRAHENVGYCFKCPIC